MRYFKEEKKDDGGFAEFFTYVLMRKINLTKVGLPEKQKKNYMSFGIIQG